MKGFESVLELTKRKGLSAATTKAVLSAQLNFQYLQQQQINALKLKGSYQEVLYLNKESRKEILWWIENLKLCNDRLIIQHQPYAILKTNASQKAWGAFCQEIPAGAECTTKEKEMLIIILELKVEKLALMSFHKQMKMKVVHFQIDNTTALM